MKHKRTI